MKTPRKILILGATSGIAEQTARVWAKAGDSFFLIARNPEKLAVVAADLKTRGASFVGTSVADLDDLDAHPKMLADAITALGGLDIAYLAHGVLGDQAKAEQDAIAAEEILHTNFTSPVSLLTWLANFCVKQQHGTLAVISSVAGDRGRKSNYVYGSAKAGLSAFLGGLRNRIDREGVTVTTIKPGPVKTSMTTGMKGQEKFADPAKVGKAIASAIDAKRDVVYVPGLWRIIMSVFRHVPEIIFKKTNT
jgi:short-subunit dehydrogenase